MSTPHINSKKEEIAKTVIMPGDPLRAKFIAENYLKEYKVVNNVRNMCAYTGKYKGKEITIMPSGMGIPSMGIYSYELFKYYDVDIIIRVGTCGSYRPNLKVSDIVLVKESYSKSTYALEQNSTKTKIIKANNELNEKIKKTTKENIFEGVIHTSDVFYRKENNYKKLVKKYDCLGVEMESFSLFHNAKEFNKKAACLLTVVDSFITNEQLDSSAREKTLTTMIELALESCL